MTLKVKAKVAVKARVKITLKVTFKVTVNLMVKEIRYNICNDARNAYKIIETLILPAILVTRQRLMLMA